MIEKSADLLEVAEGVRQQANDEAVLQARAKSKPETHPDFDGKTCVECGDDMPAERLTMQRVRCVACQTLKERSKKFFGL